MIWLTFSRPYLLGDVVDHLAAAALAKVDVDVREGNALGIEEALKEQFVLERVDVRDVQRVSHQAARGRSAARAHGNALLARVADEIPDDQEIAGEASSA